MVCFFRCSQGVNAFNPLKCGPIRGELFIFFIPLLKPFNPKEGGVNAGQRRSHVFKGTAGGSEVGADRFSCLQRQVPPSPSVAGQSQNWGGLGANGGNYSCNQPPGQETRVRDQSIGLKFKYWLKLQLCSAGSSTSKTNRPDNQSDNER